MEYLGQFLTSMMQDQRVTISPASVRRNMDRVNPGRFRYHVHDSRLGNCRLVDSIPHTLVLLSSKDARFEAAVARISGISAYRLLEPQKLFDHNSQGCMVNFTEPNLCSAWVLLLSVEGKAYLTSEPYAKFLNGRYIGY